MGSDHLRGHNPDRGGRGGDLARRLGGAWNSDGHAAALSQLHALRRGADPRPDRDAEADCDPEGRRDREADPDPVNLADGRADDGGDAHPIQPGARQLPDAAAAAHRDPEPDADTHRGWRHPDRIANADCDTGAHDAAELHAAADVDTHPGHVVGLRTVVRRVRLPEPTRVTASSG
jgi:hypothetical protein